MRADLKNARVAGLPFGGRGRVVTGYSLMSARESFCNPESPHTKKKKLSAHWARKLPEVKVTGDAPVGIGGRAVTGF